MQQEQQQRYFRQQEAAPSDHETRDSRRGYPQQANSPAYVNQSHVVPAKINEPLGLDLEKFAGGPKHATKSDGALGDQILSGHHAMCQMLTQRLTNIRVLRSLWMQDRRGAIQHVQQLNDTSISVDFIKQAVKKEKDLTLDLCVGVLPVVRHILTSSYESHLIVGLEATATIWHAFGDLITKTLATKSHVVDVSLEDRKDKCRIAKNLFGEIRLEIQMLKDRHDDVGCCGRNCQRTLLINPVTKTVGLAVSSATSLFVNCYFALASIVYPFYDSILITSR